MTFHDIGFFCCEIPVRRDVWLVQSIRVKIQDLIQVNNVVKRSTWTFPKSENWLKSIAENYQKRLVIFTVPEREKERKRERERDRAVCNFQSTKSPVEPNSLLSKFLLYHLVCYSTWLDVTLDDLQTRQLRQILLFLWNNSLAF